MSASRDKSQKLAFIYSNLYKVYQEEKTNIQIKGAVISAAHGLRPGLKIHAYKPMELLQKNKKVNIDSPKSTAPVVTIESLKKGLQELESVHLKLQFMLEDLEEYLKNK